MGRSMVTIEAFQRSACRDHTEAVLRRDDSHKIAAADGLAAIWALATLEYKRSSGTRNDLGVGWTTITIPTLLPLTSIGGSTALGYYRGSKGARVVS